MTTGDLMTNTLKDILSNKKKELDEKEPKWRQRREEWLSDVKNLYSSIEQWLSDLIEEEYIRITYENITVSEELLGVYEVEKMNITFFNNQKKTNRTPILRIMSESRVSH